MMSPYENANIDKLNYLLDTDDLVKMRSPTTLHYTNVIINMMSKCDYNSPVDIDILEQKIGESSLYRFSLLETMQDFTLYISHIDESGNEIDMLTPLIEKATIDSKVPLVNYINSLIEIGVCLLFDDECDF